MNNLVKDSENDTSYINTMMPPKAYEEKPVTLITGASSGIGRHLATYLRGLGHEVYEANRPQVDIESPYLVKKFISQITREHKHIDNLINNAGIARMNHFLTTPFETFENVLKVNLAGTFLVSQEVARVMQRNGYGRIVNLSTVAVKMSLEGESAYVASKAGVEGLTKVLARELAPFGITVNTVGPGPTPTKLLSGVQDEKIEKILSRQSINKMCDFADIENVVEFLLRPQSSMITGQVIYLGGP